MFATSTCVWSCGSPARLVRWRNAAARKPLPGTLSMPPWPRRPTAARRSMQSRALSTAASCASRTSPLISLPASPKSTLTLLGGRKVRSKPGTREPPRCAASGAAVAGVEAGAGGAPALRGGGGGGGWVGAGERRLHPASVDLALQPELARGRAGPTSGRLACARVVVLDPLRDRLEVVVLLPLAELSDRQHRGTESTWCKSVRRFAVGGVAALKDRYSSVLQLRFGQVTRRWFAS